MTDYRKMLVTMMMLGSIARKAGDDEALSETDKRIQNILIPESIKSPRPSRTEITSAARSNFKRTMHLLNKGTK